MNGQAEEKAYESKTGLSWAALLVGTVAFLDANVCPGEENVSRMIGDALR